LRTAFTTWGSLVDELLNLARGRSSQLSISRPPELNSVIEEVVSLLQPEVAGRAVTWKIGQAAVGGMRSRAGVRQVFSKICSPTL